MLHIRLVSDIYDNFRKGEFYVQRFTNIQKGDVTCCVIPGDIGDSNKNFRYILVTSGLKNTILKIVLIQSMNNLKIYVMMLDVLFK